jgi:hypothetical protein
MNWISIKERLPDIDDKTGESKIVLCTWLDFRGVPRVDAFNLYCDSDGCLWGMADGILSEPSSFAIDDDYRVTHWMPVPQPAEQLGEHENP